MSLKSLIISIHLIHLNSLIFLKLVLQKPADGIEDRMQLRDTVHTVC